MAERRPKSNHKTRQPLSRGALNSHSPPSRRSRRSPALRAADRAIRALQFPFKYERDAVELPFVVIFVFSRLLPLWGSVETFPKAWMKEKPPERRPLKGFSKFSS